MIALVIVLLSVFSAALYNFLPVDRDPSISVMMTNDTLRNVTLWHKGGDWVKADDLTVVIASGNDTHRFARQNGNLILVPEKPVFDLGSNITVWVPGYPDGGETVKLVTPRTVIYTGKVSV